MNDLESAVYKMVVRVFNRYTKNQKNILTLPQAEKILKKYAQKGYLRKGEAAEYLGISLTKFWQIRNDGEYHLNSYVLDGVVTYKKSDLDDFMERYRMTTNGVKKG
ncbi:MAG: helix-turn-helix domain-containing protein [Lactobacillus kalixensis]|uniref:helix-turn-helix domain-containing protein n=1 Tax=Lactobacillus kalixensis TaxID=227944 RepID=UPI0039949D78